MSQQRKARRKKHVGSTHVAAPALKAEMIVPDEMAPCATDLLSNLRNFSAQLFRKTFPQNATAGDSVARPAAKKISPPQRTDSKGC